MEFHPCLKRKQLEQARSVVYLLLIIGGQHVYFKYHLRLVKNSIKNLFHATRDCPALL